MPVFDTPQISPMVMKLLDDQQRQAALERAQNARIMERNEQWKQKLAFEGIDPNASQQDVARIIAGRNQTAIDTDKERLAGAQSARAFSQAAPLAESIAALRPFDPSQPDSPEEAMRRASVQSGIASSGAANDPARLQALSALIPQYRTAREDVLGAEKRGEAERKRFETRTETRARQQSDVEAWATSMAGETLGVEGMVGEQEQSRAEAVERYGEKKSIELIAQATSKAEQMVVEERLAARTLQGRSKVEETAEILMDLYDVDRKTARALAIKEAIIDPFVLNKLGIKEAMPLYGGNAQKIRESRTALINLTDRLDEVEMLFGEVQEDQNLVGPIIGMMQFQDAFQKLGIQDPKAAAYMSSMKEFVSIILKARQGSRPSDFDLAFYMSLLPSLTEVNSGSAKARFDMMQRSLELQAHSEVTPEIRKRLEGMRKKPTGAEERLEASMKKLQGHLDSLDESDPGYDTAVANATMEWMRGFERWKNNSPNVVSLEEAASMLGEVGGVYPTGVEDSLREFESGLGAP